MSFLFFFFQNQERYADPPSVESSAVCISEMLLHVSNGAYIESICLSERFLVHVEALFAGIDKIQSIYQEYKQPEFKYTREAKMLCKKIINFFSLLSRTGDMEMKKLGITQELLSLVTGLAHYLKILIRLALTCALRLVRFVYMDNGYFS